jgi:hypothetical protein
MQVVIKITISGDKTRAAADDYEASLKDFN